MNINVGLIGESANYIALFLILCFALSHAGKRHWIFALLAHFKLQYFIGGIILFVVLVFFKFWFVATLLLDVIGRSYWQLRKPMAQPWNFKPPQKTEEKAVFRVMQYNKFYKTRPYQRLKKFISANPDIDLVVMQEAENADVEPLQNVFSATLPHMLPQGSERPNYLFIASKHPIQNLTIHTLEGCKTRGVRFELNVPGFDDPITIYTVHAEMPFGKMAAVQWKELEGMANWITQDSAKNILFLGDWNTTPYTPVYQSLLKKSGLKYQDYGYLPQGTWPSFLLLPIFRIPIDHILFKGNIKLLSLKKGPCFLSDHHSLHAIFDLD